MSFEKLFAIIVIVYLAIALPLYAFNEWFLEKYCTPICVEVDCYAWHASDIILPFFSDASYSCRCFDWQNKDCKTYRGVID